MSHLSPEELNATLDGALEGAARERAERHLSECAECRAALASLTAQDSALKQALDHDPGDAYFATFAARVEDRIRAAGLGGAQARLGPEGWLSWLSSPRKLAWVGAVAAIVVGAGVVMLTSRQPQSPLQRPELLEHSMPNAQAPAPEPQNAQRQAPARSDAEALAKKDVAPAPGPEGKQRDDRAESMRELDQARSHEANARVGGKEEEITAPAPEAGARAQAATPQRAMEVRRSASGEDVPVRGKTSTFAAPPPVAAQGDLKLGKPQAAQPLEQQPSTSNLEPSVARDRIASSQLCGRVLDARQRPVAGATVAIADRGVVTTAGPDGHFCIPAAAGDHELTVMAIGYETSRLQVHVEGESSEALVTLKAVSVLDQPSGLPLGGARSETGLSREPLRKFASSSGWSLANTAAILSRRAEAARSPAAFDSAANAWSGVAASSQAGARLEALYRSADARFRAWELQATPARAAAAREAFRVYLAVAPRGGPRNQVIDWRRRVGR